MSDPQEVSEEAPELVDRAAAVDVAKASGVVCTRVPHETVAGRRVQRLETVAADTDSILALGDRLRCLGIERVVMEATGVYWKPWFFLLEACGLQVWLVNARDVKNVPGRPKTDRLDAVWLCKLNERGMLRASFVPPREIRELRDLTRTRTVLVRDRTRAKQRVEKLLEDAQIKLSSVVADLFGVSGRAMMDALVAGERDPAVLADLARGRARVRTEQLRAALRGGFTEHHAFTLTVQLAVVDFLGQQIDRLSARIEEHLAAMEPPHGPTGPAPGPPPPGPQRPGLLALVDKLTAIPGVGERAAQTILAEIGTDMSQFPTADHLASWAKLTPRTIQSGAVNTTGRTGKGNPWLRGALGEAAAAAARTDTHLGTRFKRLVKRRGYQRALVAVARSILVIVWHLVNDPDAVYQDLGADWFTRQGDPARKARDLIRQLEKLGHQVTLTPTTEPA
ncbi:transposase [Streptomyces sp. 846.5]|nr:IS110 family transposase [Streptomyces sp. 846.5]TDT98825.1 transposase [Streptomyces sp. 846.5]